MNLRFQFPAKKFLSIFILLGCLVMFFYGMGNAPIVQAQEGDPIATPEPASNYFSTTSVELKDGRQVEGIIIHGPPHPPPGQVRKTVVLPTSDLALGVNTLTVPAFNWSFGCSATSGSMIAAFYDRNGYPDIYTGPTNGGVMPLNSSVWPNWTDGVGDTYGQCPLTASHFGLDERDARGSIDDYWVSYLSNASDPYINNWTQHAWGEAIGDYMKTSQSAYGNVDGSTVFYNWTSSRSPLTCADMVSNNITVDGTYGRKLFYEARGYTVTDCYNQKTDNNRGGFTFAMFQAQIDAGRPVFLNLAGHSIVGVGYDSATQTVYLNDTWDYNTHTMTWGGSYASMKLQSVSVVNLAPLSSGTYTLSVTKAGTGSGTVTSIPSGIDCGSTCSFDYAANTSVTLNATPSDSSTFTGWSGGGCSGTGTCTVSMTSAISVTATFALNTVSCYSLTTIVKPAGSGTINVSPLPNCGTDQYNFGTVVQLTAVPNTGFRFLKWSGNVIGTQNPVSVTMDSNKTVTATFKKK